MTLQEFRTTLGHESPPRVAGALVALWHDARGDWDEAHRIAQDIAGPTGAWIHAYLHRKEGDRSNARYWYERAERPEATGPLDDEWTLIVETLLTAGP